MIQQGEATQTIGSGLPFPRDSRGLYPGLIPDQRIVRKLKRIWPYAHVEWDREMGRWRLYDMRPKFKKREALVCTVQNADGSYRNLDDRLVEQYAICVWLMRHAEGRTEGEAAQEFDRKLEKARAELIAVRHRQDEEERQARLREDFWAIKNNFDKGLLAPEAREESRTIYSHA